ncbi:MAG: hypothetical protein KDK56_02450 [Simkania sp.]|nr:hypothetical protein [Simkania sp.]MCB1075812.1 hypothetical protein [Simkania sp.]MCP5489517.1 hypothetical protein [Chlamydiales bacterium]
MATEVIKNFFNLEIISTPIPKSTLQKLKEQKDFSTLVIEKDAPAKLVRAALKHSRNVCTTLTLNGSWDNDEFRTFTPYMNQVTSLHLVNATFTNEAFDEAFISDICYENPFADDLDTYQEPSEIDEWDSVPVTLPKRPAPYTTSSLFSMGYSNLNSTDQLSEEAKKDFEEDSKRSGSNLLEIGVLDLTQILSFKTRPNHVDTPWPLPEEVQSDWLPARLEKDDETISSTHKSIINCPKLTSLTIENPKGLAKGFISKLLPLKDQLTSLTIIGCIEAPSAQELQKLFPNLQTIVIN